MFSEQSKTLIDSTGNAFEEMDAKLADLEITQILEKFAYAMLLTQVQVDGSPNFGQTQLLTVRVTYPFYLNVPFARRIFGERLGARYYDRAIQRSGGVDPVFQPFINYIFSQTEIYVVDIQEQCTMVNEGEDVHIPK